MMTIAELKKTMPQIGRIEAITRRPKRKADIELIESVEVDVNHGLEGDYYSKKGGNRMITLIQAEHLPVISAIVGSEVTHDLVRRNILISGINLKALQDASFRLGDNVILQGTGNCVPCSQMESALGPGGYNAMRGHGGITAKVIQGGLIKKGDEVSLYLNNPT